jgi:hypothetical protein
MFIAFLSFSLFWWNGGPLSITSFRANLRRAGLEGVDGVYGGAIAFHQVGDGAEHEALACE